jgi:hypothetical protein
MEIIYSSKEIEFEKELNDLDRFTLNFTAILNKLQIKYVVVSGYVSILFGRNRSSEDIDLILEKITPEKFKELWKELSEEFECIISEDCKNSYDYYLSEGYSIRFSKKGKFVPNMEIKFPKTELDKWTLENRIKVLVNDKVLFISKIEVQIPFKLFLGSEKDLEDARYLYEIFKEKIDMSLLKEFNRKLNIEELFNKYLK